MTPKSLAVAVAFVKVAHAQSMLPDKPAANADSVDELGDKVNV